MSQHAPKRPLLPRSHLLKRIQAALTSSHVVVTAPAGYGKSTLLCALAARLPHSEYLLLTPGDADLAVLEQQLQELPASTAVILLDDLHHLPPGPEATAWLQERLRNPRPRWVLAGRSLPPLLPWESLGGLPPLLLQQDDLAFRLDESRALLPEVEQAQARQWHQRTQGWPLALAMHSQVGAQEQDFAAATTLAQLFDQFAASLFGSLPPDLLHFVQQSAVPLRVNAALAAAVAEITGARRRPAA